MFLKDKGFLITSKTKASKLPWQFQVMFQMLGTYVMYLDFRRDDDNDYDDR